MEMMKKLDLWKPKTQERDTSRNNLTANGNWHSQEEEQGRQEETVLEPEQSLRHQALESLE